MISYKEVEWKKIPKPSKALDSNIYPSIPSAIYTTWLEEKTEQEHAFLTRWQLFLRTVTAATSRIWSPWPSAVISTPLWAPFLKPPPLTHSTLLPSLSSSEPAVSGRQAQHVDSLDKIISLSALRVFQSPVTFHVGMWEAAHISS